MKIKYVRGDATRPVADGNKIIVHICNDIGAWGSGFVLAVSRRWTKPKNEYLKLRQIGGYKLGRVDLIQVEDDIWVANMIAQHDIRTRSRLAPIRYTAVRKCLEKISDQAVNMNASVHMPRIGCGLAGGSWDKIEPIVVSTLERISVTVYDLPH